MPYCPFCCRNHQRKRGEHVIPRWLAREFPDIKWDLNNRLTNYVRKGEKYINIVTPVPCTTCDNGWMSDLEQVAKPILLPLLHGKLSSLTMSDQVTIATWFFKTVVMYDLHAEHQALRPRYFEADEHQLLRSELSIFPSYRFFTGKYSGDQFFFIQETHCDAGVASTHDLKPIADPVWGYTVTLLIKHLVLQAYCAKLPPVSHTYEIDFRRFSLELRTRSPALWPPRKLFDDFFLDKFTYGRKGIPPPP